MPKHRIIVGISGGVDSAVAASLLQKAGHEVEGIFMKNWEEDDNEDYCSAAEDLSDAEQICDKLGIMLHTVNFSTEYWDQVFQYFIEEYQVGRTPNPDILCNTEIKFKAFLDHANGMGADYIATGHYARVKHGHNSAALLSAKDHNKDQTYFLHGLNQTQLQSALFPLGDLEKPKVRKLAEQLGLPVFDKKDSTGICFIGERKFRTFLQQYVSGKPGDIVDEEFNVIGQHQGSVYYTIGQRSGLGIGGTAKGSEQPWYVADKDIENNQILAVQGHDHPKLMHQSLSLEKAHWINSSPKTGHAYAAKIRYRQSAQACTISKTTEDQWQIDFTQPQRAITPGQYAVLYDQEQCLGGGIIRHRFNLS